VWLDVNKDGLQDKEEPGLSDVTVTLYEDDGSTHVDDVTTDSDGIYNFYDLDPGDYIVHFTTLS